jgi:hypothetical protein
MSPKSPEGAPIAPSATESSLLQLQQQGPMRRPARSKTGCTTCRVRKVRCDETRPRCSHCFRLNLECRWRPPPSQASRRLDPQAVASQHRGSVTTAQGHQGHSAKGMGKSLSPPSSTEGAGDNVSLQPHLGAMDQMFDYASFMWDAMPAVLGQFSPEWPAHVEGNSSAVWRVSDHATRNLNSKIKILIVNRTMVA